MLSLKVCSCALESTISSLFIISSTLCSSPISSAVFLKERRYHLIYRLITRYADSVKYFQENIIRTNQTDNYFYCLLCINPGLAGSYLSSQQYIFELVYLELEKYSGIASGTVDLNFYFARLLTDFYDAYLKQFITQGINQKNYELARFIRIHFAKSRLFPELADSLSLADAVDNKRLNVSDCFFNTKWMKTLTEARENYISSAESIIRIHPYGFLAATKNSEELKPELFYSGLKMQFNEKAITVSMGGVTYRPVAFGRDSGLWLHIPSSMKNDSHQSPKYGHIVTTGCLMGCTVWGIFKMGDQEIRLSLTQPNIEIPSGACLVKIFVEHESHVYPTFRTHFYE